MNSQTALNRILKARREWLEAGHGPEISWTARGIEMAAEIIRQMVKEERVRMEHWRPRIHRWLAGALYRAIISALQDLSQGKKERAMATLRRAVDYVDEQKA